MAIEFRCIRCGQRLRVADENEGLRARCPTCNAVVDVPSFEEPAPIVMSRPKSDVIDYELFGDESQYVEITLDPGEVAAARIENLLFMTAGIAMETVKVGEQDTNGGLLERLSQVGRRILTDSMSMTAFCNVAEQREVVAFAPSAASRLVPVLMNEYDQQLYCQASTVLCLARGIEVSDCSSLPISHIIGMHRLAGDGLAVLQSPGTLSHHRLSKDRYLNVRTRSIVAFTAEISASQHVSVGVEDPLPITSVRGPGEIWLSSAF